MTLQANLTNRDAVGVPQAVREVELRAAARPGRPATRSRRRSTTRACRRAGPAFVSIPMDDWEAEVEPGDYAARSPDRRRPRAARPEAIAALAERLRAAAAPGARRRPGHRRLGRLGRGGRARRAPAPGRLGLARRPAAGGSASPRTTRPSRACCRRPSGRSAKCSPATTSCSSPARRSSPTTRTSPATCSPTGTALVAITSDPDEAARAPMGDAIVADVALTLRALVARARRRRATARRRRRAPTPEAP